MGKVEHSELNGLRADIEKRIVFVDDQLNTALGTKIGEDSLESLRIEVRRLNSVKAEKSDLKDKVVNAATAACNTEVVQGEEPRLKKTQRGSRPRRAARKSQGE